MYDKGDGKNSPVVSAKQRFFYVGDEALNQGLANNTTAGRVQGY
jgi:hypothetical protein